MKSIDIIEKDLDHICFSSKDEMLKLSGKDVLITGGAGFLGYYLVQSLLHCNDKNTNFKPINLTVYDNLFRGTPEWIKSMSTKSNFKLINKNIVDITTSNMPFYNYIIHAASIASPIFYRQFPIETMDANVIGLRKLLDHALKSKESLEGFLFFSTSEIYGDPDDANIPTHEDYRGNVSCTGPRACYDESKRYGETMCVNFAKQHGLPIGIARPFNNYGPGLKIEDGRVIPDFAQSIFKDEDIILFSDGSPTRTFCYVADAITGYIKILTSSVKGESYNIGIEKPEISILNLAELFIKSARKLYGYNGKVVTKLNLDKEYLIDNPNRRCPSIEKARQQLNFNPSIDLDEGIKRSLIWYSNK